MAVVLLPDYPAGYLAQVYVVALLDYVADPVYPVGQLLGNLHLELYPVGVLREAHVLYVLDVVGVIVDQRHGAEPVETLHEQTLRVEIRESEGADHRLHAILAAELLHLVHQGPGDLGVVDEVVPAETNLLVVPLLVGQMVHYRSHASGKFAVLVGKVELRVAELLRRALLLVERVHLVEHEGRNVIRVVLI